MNGIDFAQPSEAVKRAMRKIQAKCSKQEVTPDLLNATKEKISKIYARNQSERVVVKGKDMALFAEGKEVKEPSPKVRAVLEELKRSFT